METQLSMSSFQYFHIVHEYTFQTGLTALHLASQYGQTDLVREMLTLVPATLKSDTPVGGESGVKDYPAEVVHYEYTHM